MNRRKRFYSRTPWFCWLGLLAGVLVVVPGAAYVTNAPAQTVNEPDPFEEGIARVKQLGGRVDVTTNQAGKRSLSVTFSRKEVTDEQLDVLSTLPNLESLYLFSSKVTDAGVEKLAKLKTLRELQLLIPQVTDAGLADLELLTELRLLVLLSENVTSALSHQCLNPRCVAFGVL